jgi:hypothetical protein
MKAKLETLATALAAYEANPFDDAAALAVDQAASAIVDDLPETEETALHQVVNLALDEDGFRFIPAARVLCAAIQKGL